MPQPRPQPRPQPGPQPRAESTIEVRPIAGAIGAEIYGVDLGGELSEATIGAIRRAWLEHCVVFFRDQPLPPEQFLRFARRFGEIVEYPFIRGLRVSPKSSRL